MLAALCALALCGCLSRGPKALKPPLRVGMSLDYPPLAYAEDGKPAGVEVELAELAGEALDRRIRVVPMDFSDLIPALVDDRIDVIMSGMSVTPERSLQVRFAEPYLRVGQMAVIRRSDLARFPGSRMLNQSGVRVGFEMGTTGEAYVRGQLPNAIPVAFTTIDEGLPQLRAGQIDVFIHDAPSIWRVTLDPAEKELMGLYEPLTEEYLAWAVRRDDRVLASQLSELVRRWQREGQIERAVSRRLPVRVQLR